MSEITALFVGVGQRPKSVILNDDYEKSISDLLGDKTEKLWPFCDPNVCIVCKKDFDTDLKQDLNRYLKGNHETVRGKVFGDFIVTSVNNVGKCDSLSNEKLSSFSDMFRDVPYYSRVFSDADIANAPDYDCMFLVGDNIEAEYHADTLSFRVHLIDRDFWDGFQTFERRQALWDSCTLLWSTLFPHSGVGYVSYFDDTMGATVYSNNLEHRLSENIFAIKNLRMFRHPEKKARLTMTGWLPVETT